MMAEANVIRPYVVAEMSYATRPGVGAEESDICIGYFTGEMDTWGKLSFVRGDGIWLYLFPDEIQDVDYLA